VAHASALRREAGAGGDPLDGGHPVGRSTIIDMLKLKREKFGGITVAGVKQKEGKNRGTQLLFLLAMLVTGFGGVLSYGGSIVGYLILLTGLLSLTAIFIWALRNWDY
jgi:hypothetical protein